MKNNQGGIFLSLLVLLTMISTMYLFVIEDSQARQSFYLEEKNYYTALIIENMAITKINEMTVVQNTELVYNVGKVHIKARDKDKKVQITTVLNNDFKLTREIKINSQE